ncbi:hypothetical protein [Desulfothermus naphthae]
MKKRFEEIDKCITDRPCSHSMMIVFGGLVVAMIGCLYFELAEVMKTFGLL